MKTKKQLNIFLLAAASSLLAISNASAQTNLIWDTSATVGITGGAGAWDTTTTNWTADAGASNIVWDNSSPVDFAIFRGTAGAVTLGEPISLGGLTFFSSSGYSIAAGSHGLTFGAAANTARMINATNVATSTAAITGTVTGAGDFALTSSNPGVASTLTFGGTSAGGWSGATTINAGGIISLSGLNQALLSTTGINLNNGGITLTNTSAPEAALDRVSDTAGIISRGGNITVTNTASATTVYAETLGALDLRSGQLNVTSTNANTDDAASQTLTFGTGSLTHVNGLARTSATTSAINFSGASLGANVRNSIIITGQATTAADQIIAPWVTYGGNDYAVYDNTLGIQAANISATTEDTWATAANAYSLSGGTTLTDTRTFAALRATGGAQTLALDTFNLETTGILNGGTGLLTVSGTGALTTPTGGGNIYLSAGSNAITVSASITDNGGNVTLVKNGANTLTLSGTNTYTGGTVINAGNLSIGNVGHLGGASASLTFGGNGTLTPSVSSLNFSTGSLTVNQGAVANISGNPGLAFASASGSGTLIYRNTVAAGTGGALTLNIGNASAYTGTIQAVMGGATNSRPNVQFSAISDSVGSALQFGGGNGDGSQDVFMTYNGSAPLVFNNRRIEILPLTTSSWGVAYSNLVNNSANAANTWVINTNLVFMSYQARSLALAGTNTGNNSFNGLISDGDAGGSVGLLKSGSGTWILPGTNTFTGGTILQAGTLRVSSIKNYGVASSLGAPASGDIAFGTLSGAGSGTATLAYTGSGDSSNRTIRLHAGSGISTLGGTIENNGTGALTFTAAAFNTPFSNSTSRALTLGGSYTGGNNTIQGVIANNPTGTISLVKSGNSTWVLSGANSYPGTTSVNGGTLLINGDQTAASGAVSVAANATLGGTGTIGGNTSIANNGRLAFNFSTAPGIHDKLELAASRTLSFGANATLTITSSGGATAGLYTLVTAPGGIGGLPAFTVNLPSGWTADAPTVSGNDLVINVTSTGSSSAYDTWKAANAPGSDPDDDTDGDGVSNAVEFVLGGTSATKDANKLPVIATSGANMTVTFQRAVSSIDPKTSVTIETSTDLVTWNTAPSPYTVPDTAVAAIPGVTVVEDTSLGFDTITLTVPQAPDTKKFARLKVVITP